MSATGIAGYWPLFEPRVPGFTHIPPLSANALEEAILREGADTVAMFLAEPVIGVGGVIVPPDDYFPRIREICDRHDVLFAADEVITGFGRTGKWFALEHWDVAPDIVQFAKAITSGYFPFGGVGVSDRSHASWTRRPDRGCTPIRTARIRSGAPSRCARCRSSRRRISSPKRRARARCSWRRCAHALAIIRTSARFAARADVRRGVREGPRTKAPFAPEEQVGARIHAEAVARGLFSRVRGDMFVLAPPFVTPDDVLDRIAEILAAAARSVLPA